MSLRSIAFIASLVVVVVILAFVDRLLVPASELPRKEPESEDKT